MLDEVLLFQPVTAGCMGQTQWRATSGLRCAYGTDKAQGSDRNQATYSYHA